jgi:hypothetical protein
MSHKKGFLLSLLLYFLILSLFSCTKDTQIIVDDSGDTSSEITQETIATNI